MEPYMDICGWMLVVDQYACWLLSYYAGMQQSLNPTS